MERNGDLAASTSIGRRIDRTVAVALAAATCTQSVGPAASAAGPAWHLDRTPLHRSPKR
jgi:hypothetical protein